jgi:hypothetical protein
MKLLSRIFPRRLATEQRTRLAGVQRMLDERHERDKRERERLYRDLTTARQQLAVARQTAPPPPRTHTPNLIIDRLIIPRLRPRPNDDTKGRR